MFYDKDSARLSQNIPNVLLYDKKDAKKFFKKYQKS